MSDVVTESASAEDMAALLDILGGRARSQAVSTAAALGLPELLAHGPRSAQDLALELGADEQAVGRLLSFLAGLGFLRQEQDGALSLTRLGLSLRQDALGPLASFLGSPDQWNPWSALRDSLGGTQQADNAFVTTHGTDLYSYMRDHASAAARYDVAIDAFTRQAARTLATSFDFSGISRLVDVGGGRGAGLQELLKQWPNLHGVLFDLPHVARAAREHLAPELAARVECVGGDFLKDVPGDADAYLLKHVLHNWDDEQAVQLLRRCAQQVPDTGYVLVLEYVLAPDGRIDTARMMDLEMLVLTNGRERRKPELRRLIRAAGLTLEGVTPLPPASWLLVCRPIRA